MIADNQALNGTEIYSPNVKDVCGPAAVINACRWLNKREPTLDELQEWRDHERETRRRAELRTPAGWTAVETAQALGCSGIVCAYMVIPPQYHAAPHELFKSLNGNGTESLWLIGYNQRLRDGRILSHTVVCERFTEKGYNCLEPSHGGRRSLVPYAPVAKSEMEPGLHSHAVFILPGQRTN